jgi:ABC-type amino acid transport substrate-binding protein
MERHLRYASFDDLAAALNALGHGEADAVVNSIGALQYLVSTRFKNNDQAAPGRSRARLYGDRASARQLPQETDR